MIGTERRPGIICEWDPETCEGKVSFESGEIQKFWRGNLCAGTTSSNLKLGLTVHTWSTESMLGISVYPLYPWDIPR